MLRNDVAIIFADAGHIEEARSLTLECRDECRRSGDQLTVVFVEAQLAQFDLDAHNYEAAQTVLASALESTRRQFNYPLETEVLRDLGYALLGLQRRSEARAAFANLLQLATADRARATIPLFAALAGLALTADPDEPAVAARLRGALSRLRHDSRVSPEPRSAQLERHFEQPFIEALGEEAWAREQAAGATMSLDEAVELARTLAQTGSHEQAR